MVRRLLYLMLLSLLFSLLLLFLSFCCRCRSCCCWFVFFACFFSAVVAFVSLSHLILPKLEFHSWYLCVRFFPSFAALPYSSRYSALLYSARLSILLKKNCVVFCLRCECVCVYLCVYIWISRNVHCSTFLLNIIFISFSIQFYSVCTNTIILSFLYHINAPQ